MARPDFRVHRRLLLLRSLWQALKLVPPQHSVQALQVGTLSIVFWRSGVSDHSHQQFSGDPVSGLLVTMFARATLGRRASTRPTVSAARDPPQPNRGPVNRWSCSLSHRAQS